jgi:hypothetical protein
MTAQYTVSDVSSQSNGVENPHHPVPEEVAAALQSLHEHDLAEMKRQERIAQLARLDREERSARGDIYKAAARAAGIDIVKLQAELSASRANTSRRVTEALESDLAPAGRPFELSPVDTQPTSPERADHDFWLAESQWWHPGDWTADLRADGLHFTGHLTHDSGDLRFANFGSVSFFELQPERIPPSASGRWRSAPHIELFGGMIGQTTDGDIFTGDQWSKCWLYLRQTLLQFHFGPTGPVPVVVGQTLGGRNLFFLDGESLTAFPRFSGFEGMPWVDFGNINTASLSLWAHLEVRFDIQVEGAGSLVWTDPDVLLRGFQWPLIPL